MASRITQLATTLAAAGLSIVVENTNQRWKIVSIVSRAGEWVVRFHFNPSGKFIILEVPFAARQDAVN